MSAIVFTSAGSRKYHFDEKCKAFESAQMLRLLRRLLHPPLARLARPKRMSATKASMDGKLPCLVCVPEHLRELPDVDSFGHEPELEDPSPFTEQRFTYCRRCLAQGQQYDDEYGESRRYPRSKVRWPCTSAIVLGLVPRPEQVGER